MNRNRILSLLMCNMILFSGSSVVFAENSKELSNRNIIKLKEIKKEDSINSISINNDFFNEMTSEYHIVGKITKVEDKDNGKYILVERNGAPMEVLISEDLDIHGGFENIKVGNFIDIRGKESEKGHFIEGEECIVSEKPIGIKALSAEKIAFREVDNIDYVSLNVYDIKDEQIQKWVSNNKKKSGAHLLEKDDAYFILVSGGECSTGGYSLDIMNVNLSEENLDITYNVVPPAPDMCVTSALTYPSQILKISKDKKIEEVNAVKSKIGVIPKRPEVRINKKTTLGEIEDAVKNMKNPQEKLNLIEKLIKWVTELF
ncbi:protease complex subunit PrcB family protein [Oceanirhabdus seepicola]|uniref:Protease complex subunit PrcB family protein n=1 Tax=Oceanirhabdus seepicola TaxID=2828781 RepID=A0A9J6P5Q4_9CLOT|nr:protease complex subunit PrcB family protein [Oceanirhabdus seepicola]MCM1991572.1 protease complex subunit PrcB family protein [Oceanirhabdus seepicola]